MIKITKGMARKLYNEGKEIMVLPNRISTTSSLAGWIEKPKDNPVSFEQVCNTIFYYNCSPETGMSLAYYAKEV